MTTGVTEGRAELLARLWDVLQRLKAASPDEGAASGRWYVARRARDLTGPYQAAELVWLVFRGDLALDDELVDGPTGARRRVGADPFLAAWREADERAQARLVRALTSAVRARAAALAAARRADRQRALSAEQRRAFVLLQLDPDCSPHEARARMRALASHHHPDRGGSVERMQEITTAFRHVTEAVRTR